MSEPNGTAFCTCMCMLGLTTYSKFQISAFKYFLVNWRLLYFSSVKWTTAKLKTGTVRATQVEVYLQHIECICNTHGNLFQDMSILQVW